MAVKAAKIIRKIADEKFEARIKAMLEMRNEFSKDVSNYHIKLQEGNSKTGRRVMTISLIPVIDCLNCTHCMYECYDVRNDCCYPSVQKSRAINSAVHKADQKRFWEEIEMQIKAFYVECLRINVGGDLNRKDFDYLTEIAERNPQATFLFFTKNYKEANEYLDVRDFPKNVQCIFSAWEGMEMSNPHNMPCSHVLYVDGRTTAPAYGAILCTGDCTECYMEDRGCFTLKKGEHVVFPAH
jgi:hypothetical protein